MERCRRRKKQDSTTTSVTLNKNRIHINNTKDFKNKKIKSAQVNSNGISIKPN